MNSQAEVKLLKVGETLASNVDGNTEPSIITNVIRACVETGQGVCIKCNNVITNKRKGLKFCSSKCRSAYNAYQWCLRNNKFVKPGVGSGGSQEGEDNHMYKTGKGSYSKKGFANLPNICNRCQSLERLLVHHIDENRDNNELHNLEILCKRCHQKHHETRDEQGKYAKVQSTSI